MNFPAWCALWGGRAEAVSGSSLGRRRQTPDPQSREPMPEDLVSHRRRSPEDRRCCAELADWVGVTVGGDADHMHVGMHIDSGRVRVDDLEVPPPRRTGTGSDLSRDFLGWVGFLGSLVGFLGFSSGTTMDVSGSRMRGGETTKRRAPRGVSGTLEVSPTGSIPRRENPAGKSPMTRSKPLWATLRYGQGAPKGIRPRTRVTRPRSEGKRRSKPDLDRKFTGREGAAEGGMIGFAVLQACKPATGSQELRSSTVVLLTAVQ